MLTRSRGLDARSLAAIRALEADVVQHDGGRLKLEHGVLEVGDVDCALWWAGERLLGFAGVYDFGGVEIAGMVAPDARRQGIGRALLDAALETVAGRDGVLLVVPSTSLPGRALAESRGATLSHSEHFLVLGDLPSEVAEDDAVTPRGAAPTDWPQGRRGGLAGPSPGPPPPG